MLSTDLSNLADMTTLLADRHGGLTAHHAEVVVMQLKVLTSRARMLEQSAIVPAARAQTGGNVVSIGKGGAA